MQLLLIGLMERKEHISIQEFDDDNYKIRYEANVLCEPKAVVTHYLQNIHNTFSENYKEEAFKAIGNLIKYKKVKDNSIVKDIALQQLLFEVENVAFPALKNYNFKFIDLFAGIGGFRLALQNIGGKCVYSSEWNKDAQKTYRENFGEIPFGDITKELVKNYIPENFDILCAGFPCQAFSIAGYQKGFSDTRGTLFFDIEQIFEKHQYKLVA